MRHRKTDYSIFDNWLHWASGCVIKMLPVLSVFLVMLLFGCKSGAVSEPDPVYVAFNYNSIKVNGDFSGFDYKGINSIPVFKISFTAPIDQISSASSITITDKNLNAIPVNLVFENKDSTVTVKPASPLKYLSGYTFAVSNSLKSKAGSFLSIPFSVNITTGIDSTDKFPVISNDALLTLIQKQTFKYFWDFGHPVSGMSRERNTSGDVVTSGGTGFGIMTIPVAIDRKFITRVEGVTRVQKIADFLKNNATHFHGAFSHWMNGSSGAVIPFSPNDNGADIVETSYLMMGLLTARQYFDDVNASESKLRTDINTLLDGVEWDWFRKEGSNMLYWNWSPDFGFVVNVPVRGWNECLVTYVIAASSTTHSIPKIVYDNGFARNGANKNGSNYYGIVLPLGESFGGPLFFEHYSFLGINPNGLSDVYANYLTQAVNHSKINFEYCKANPKGYYGYSKDCWGLTASDIKDGYTASSPTNDQGYIAPTAAISSLPFTPVESLQAINFFYYKMGDHLWGEYGFVDSFNLNTIWFANSYLAIDQGPQIVMIENYRTGLLWKLFMSSPEIKTGMKNLGFQCPNL